MKPGIRRFLLTTSMHGWGHVEREPGIIRKTIWIAFLLTVVMASLITVYQNADQVITKLDTIGDLDLHRHPI